MDISYLKEIRSHIAIVGKFSVAKEEERLVTADFANASSKLDFSFYATEETVKINDVEMRCSIPTTASRLAAEQETNIRDGEKGAPARIQLSGTALGAALLSGDLTDAEIGGRLYVNLLDALDRMMPFWHPNFDTLLCEAFVEFYGRLHGRSSFVGQAALRDLVMSPEICMGLLAFLRGDVSQGADYIESLQDAARKTEEYAAFGFSLGDPSDADSHISQIIDDLRRFKGALELDRDSSAWDASDARRLQLLDESATLSDLCRSLIVPGYPAVASVSSHLQDMFRAFQNARTVVENSAASEPMMALMVAWAMSKLGRDTVTQAAVLEREFFGNEEAQGIPLSRWEDLGEAFTGTIKKGLAEAQLSANQSAVADPVLERGVKNWDQNAGVVRVYTRTDLIRDVTKLFKRIVGRLVPGVRDCAAENESMIRDICDLLRDFRHIRNAKLTVGALTKRYAGRSERWDAWLETFCADREGLKGMELAAEFEMGCVRDYAALTFVERTTEFLKREKAEIDRRLDNAHRALEDALKEDAEDVARRVSRAPAGGTAVGVVAGKGGDGTEADAEDAARRMKRLRKRRKAGGTDEGASEEHDAAGAADDGDERDPGADGAGTAASGEDEGGAEGVFSEEQTRPDEPPLPEEDQVVAEQNLETFRRQVFDELNLLDDDDLKEARAEVRAYLFGEYMVRTKQSPLGVKDGSIGAHLLFRLINAVGIGTERVRGEGRERLKAGTQDLACGILKVPIAEVVQVDPSNVRRDLDRFAEYWGRCAAKVKSLADDIDDFADIVALAEDLADSRESGTVTIVNETIEEHVSRVPKEQRLLSSGKGVKPPGIVYVTRQAHPSRDRGKSISLDGVAKGLFDHEDGPLYLPSDNDPLTIGQRKQHSENRGWSLPIFVGRSVRNAARNGRNCLPVASLDVPGLSAAVVFLAGLAPGTARWQNEAGIDSRTLKAFAGLLKSFDRSTGQLGISEGCPLRKAWREVLSLPDCLPAQCLSKIVSYGLNRRLSAETPRKATPDLKASFYAMLDDLAEVYAGDGYLRKEARARFCARMLIGGKPPVPEQEMAKFDTQELSVDDRKTATDYVFGLV